MFAITPSEFEKHGLLPPGDWGGGRLFGVVVCGGRVAPCPLAHGTGGEVANSEWSHPTEPGLTAQAALMANEIWSVDITAGSVREPGSRGGRPRPAHQGHG